jgi:hypothetical protein
MIQINDDGFFEIFPFIKTITHAFEYQNSMLNKIVLTGKINALEIAENLFDFTEKTADTFAILQKKLIENLLEENKKSIEIKAKLKVESVLSILVKNLYETTKNIELLSQNRDIIDFLNGNISKKDITNILHEYKSKYSIYNEVLLISYDRRILANINPKNKMLRTNDEIFDEVFKTDRYIQAYKKTDMIIFQKQSLFFAKRVLDDNGNLLGAVVLSFDLENEMKTVFEKILEKNEVFSIVDKFGNLIVSSEYGIDKKFLRGINKVDKSVILDNKLNYKTKAKEYQNYSVDWYGIITLRKEEDVNILLDSENENQNSIKQLIDMNVKNIELKKLTDEAYSILEDLSDVIINGELIAAKSKQYILIPILDNLREVSYRVVKLIEVSISSLQKVINDSFTNDVKSISRFIMFSVIENMYEMINDVRWWSFDKIFIEELSSKEPNTERIKNELIKIDNIYLNYANMFIYDTNGKVIVASKSGDGLEIEDKIVLSKSDGYYISEYKPSKFYDNKPTYICYSPIKKDEKTIGGIGIVFEIKEFEDMLKSIFNVNGFALILNKKREIISSTFFENKESIIDKLFEIELKDGNIEDIEIEDKTYKISVSHFDRYREYQNKELFTIVVIEK